MLAYHPAFDIYHGIFRILTILDTLTPRAYEKQRISILDFYFLFPFEMTHASFPQEHLRLKAPLRRLSNSYDNIENPKRFFQRLQPYQEAALESLSSYNLIDPKLFRDRAHVERTTVMLPTELMAAIQTSKTHHITELGVLKVVFESLNLQGPKGIKQRTDLFESRYDFIPSNT